MEYNVLIEPWIPVIYKDGRSTEVGITRCLDDADKISTISNSYPYEKIAIIRLLTAFVSDAYELEKAKDREKLYQSGRFDRKVIDSYIENCISKYSASFDLFDEKRPFMVSAYNSTLDPDKTILSAAYLHLHLPHGDNIIHVVAQTEDDFKGDRPGEFLRSVLATYLYPTGNAMKGADTKTGVLCYIKDRSEDGSIIYGTQYGSMGINAGPSMVAATPVLWWPEGESLFSTLVMCMRSRGELGNLPLNNPEPPWKTSKEILGNTNKRGEPVTSVSFVSALTFQSRRIVPITDADGLIRRAYISNGYVNPDNVLWHDPFCIRLRNHKTGELYNLQADASKIPWRNVGNLTAASDHDWHLMPDVLKPIKKYDEVHYEAVYSLGMVPKTENAGYDAMLFDDTVSIPSEYMSDAIIGAFLTKCMEIIEEASSCWDSLKISKILGNKYKASGKYRDDEISKILKNKDKASGRYRDDALNEYWALMHNFLFAGKNSFLSELLNLYHNDIDYENRAMSILLDRLDDTVKRICSKEEKMTNSWEMLVIITKCTNGQGGCIHTFNKIKKKYVAGEI